MTQHIKNLLSGIIRAENNWKLSLIQNWNTIIGNLSAKVTLEKIYEDTLVLGVDDSCWMQELYLLSPLLIKTINEKLDQPRIKQVRFKNVGYKKKKEQEKKSQQQQHVQKKIVLTYTQQQALASIKDPALQSALKAFLIRCYRERE